MHSAKYLLVVLLLSIPSAQASEIVFRGEKAALKVNATQAEVDYADSVVLCCAINARHPSRSVPQVKFQKKYGQMIKGSCIRVNPPIFNLIRACKAPDGSIWAVQHWKRLRPNYGGVYATPELHASHWKGPLPVFQDIQWSTRYGLQRLCGKFTYLNHGIYGFSSTSAGVPLDSYGRNVYLDSYNSDYGPGWRRVNSFLTHAPDGSWCYLFAEHSGGMGVGEKYRVSAIGPGVTPAIRLAILPPSAP